MLKLSKMTTRWSPLLLASLLLVSSAFAGFSKVGTTAAAFLKISVGRPTGMGDAFVAIADDPAAAYFNPAGLAQLGQREVMLNHVAWIAGMSHENITGVLPVSGVGTFALSVTALNTGNMEQTQLDDPSSPAREDLGTGLIFSGTDIAIAATYSRLITDKLAFGFSARSVTEAISNMSASGLGADVGLLYNTGWNNLRVGASVCNFGSDLAFSGLSLDFVDSTQSVLPPATYKTTPAPLPITFRFGLASDFVNNDRNKLTAALDLVHASDINETVNFGMEYGFMKSYFIRAGYILNTDASYATNSGWLQGLSAGAGVLVKPAAGFNLKLDYGYRNQGYLGGTHRVTLGVGF